MITLIAPAIFLALIGIALAIASLFLSYRAKKFLAEAEQRRKDSQTLNQKSWKAIKEAWEQTPEQ